MSVPWYLMAKGKGGGGYKTASGPIVSVNNALAAPLRSLLVNIDPVQEGTGDPSPDNVRPISGWSAVNVWVKHTYDPTANPTATLQLGQTVYGGTLDVTNGVLTVTLGKVLLPSTGWAYYQTAGRNTFNIAISGCKEQGIGHCDRYTYSDTPYIANQPDKSFILYRQNVSTVKISICDNDYTDASVFGDSVEGAELVYELATPITIPLTPTQISTLQGQNNVWADTGDVTVEYLSAGGANPDLMKLAVAFMGRR